MWEWLYDHGVSFLSACASFATLWVAVRNLRKTDAVYHATNSLTDRLVATSKSEAYAAGVKFEKDRSDDARDAT